MGSTCSIVKDIEKPIVIGEIMQTNNFCVKWYSIIITNNGENPLINLDKIWKIDINNIYVGIDRQLFLIDLNDKYPTTENEFRTKVTKIDIRKLNSQQIYNVCFFKNMWYMLRSDIN